MPPSSTQPPPSSADGPEPDESRRRRNARLRFAALLLLIVALTITAALTPLHRIQDAVATAGWWAPAAAVVAGALLLCALVPRTAVSLACGALFGALAGGTIALVAALLSSVITFAVGRALGREAIAAHAGGRLGRLDHWFARRGLLGVVVVRLLPIAPYGLVGYAYGTTSVRVRTYLAGTAIGGAPSAYSYAAIGAAVVAPGAIGWLSFLPAAVGLLVTVGAALWWRFSPGQRSGQPPSASG